MVGGIGIVHGNCRYVFRLSDYPVFSDNTTKEIKYGQWDKLGIHKR